MVRFRHSDRRLLIWQIATCVVVGALVMDTIAVMMSFTLIPLRVYPDAGLVIFGTDTHHLALGLMAEPCYSGEMYTFTYSLNLLNRIGGANSIIFDPCTQAIVRLSDHQLLFYW